LDILGHNGDTLGMDGTEVSVLEKTNQVCFRSLLESHDSRGLETEVSFEVLSNLTHQTLEGEFPDEKFSALLVATDFSEGNSTWPVTVRLLDTSCSRGRLASCLGGQLLARSLASCGLTGGLLGTSHGERMLLMKIFASKM
jgi:hypothetical protein